LKKTVGNSEPFPPPHPPLTIVHHPQSVAGAVSSSSSAYAFASHADKAPPAGFGRPDRRYSAGGGGAGSPLDHIGGGGYGATHFGGVVGCSFGGAGNLDVHSRGTSHHGYLQSSGGGWGASCSAKELEQRVKQWNRTTHSRRVLEDMEALDKTLGRRHSK